MIDTSISIGAVRIHEPVTVLTDIIIAVLAIYFYNQLKRNAGTATAHWSRFFLFLGLATFTGSFSHALFEIHEGWHYKFFWLSMQIINGIGIYFAQQATLCSVLEHSTHKSFWKWSYVIQFVLFIAALLLIQKYIVSVLENAIGLIPILILHYKNKANYAKIIANGISISFLTAIVNLTKLSFNAYFNYNDIAHVFIMMSIFVMYKGIKGNAEAQNAPVYQQEGCAG